VAKRSPSCPVLIGIADKVQERKSRVDEATAIRFRCALVLQATVCGSLANLNDR